MPTDEIMETLTDERLEPHIFLGGLLLLTLVVALGFFYFFPAL